MMNKFLVISSEFIAIFIVIFVIFIFLSTTNSQLITIYASVDIGQQYDFGNIASLGQGVNLLVAPAFSLATLAVVIYFLIGAFKYLTSGGDKEAVGDAQKMITHAIVGFVILMFVFLILQFIPSVFGISFSIF